MRYDTEGLWRFLAALVIGAVVTPSAKAQINYGYVLVIGEGEPGTTHDDRGPHPDIMGEVFEHSKADSVSTGSSPATIDPFLVSGRVPIGYAHRGMDADDIATYASRGVHHYVFENEPEGRGGNWAQDYMDGLIPAYALIHSVDPQAVVIGGNLFSNHYNQLYDLGFKDYCDMVGFHCYSDDPATGIAILDVVGVHNTMAAYGDGAKEIYLGEGWGPKRELRGNTRLSPDLEIQAEEVETLRDFVVNGYRNIITAQGGYQPSWIFGVHFFTFNDNWGGFHWRDRAVPVYDGQGNLLYYTVDGYNVGLNIDPHFYNGGLVDYYGNSKDNLMDIFPGNGLSINNGGFEYHDPLDPEVASSWETGTQDPPAGSYVVDRSIRRQGRRSQRVTIVSGSREYVSTDTVRGSVTAGNDYLVSAWVRTHEVVRDSHDGVRVGIAFCDSSANPLGATTWSSPALEGTQGWTQLTATASAPFGVSFARVTIDLSADDGRVWWDDVTIVEDSTTADAAFSGYVLDQNNAPINGATVELLSGGYQTTTGTSGYFTLSGVAPGIYDVQASATGYSSQIVRAQVAEPGHTNVLGFALKALSSTDPTNTVCWNPEISGTIHVSWAAPTGSYDVFRLYRSQDPLDVGTLVQDNVTGSPVWDTGLSDGEKYYYTVRAVSGGVESTNEDRVLAIPTGGLIQVAYDVVAAPTWPWGYKFGQTFTPTITGSIVSATCIPAGTQGANVTFRIREDGPGGVQIGPSKTLVTAANVTAVAQWQTGEIPVVAGQDYYLECTSDIYTAMYVCQLNDYPAGSFHLDDVPDPGKDFVSTISVVTPKPAIIDDVSAEPLAGGTCRITWRTDIPSTSQVAYGTRPSLGQMSAYNATLTQDHEVVLTGLHGLTPYHFEVLSTRPSHPDATSPDYVFTTLGPKTLLMDNDRDGDVDQDDYGWFQSCMTGPVLTNLVPGCLDARLDADEDIDGTDLLVFIDCFSGSNIPSDESCMD